VVQPASIRALKAIVILLSAIIVVGLGVLAYGTVQLVRNRAADSRPAEPAASAVEPFNIRLPAGARVLEMDLDGDRLAVRLDLGGGRESIQIYDVRTGMTVGVVTP